MHIYISLTINQMNLTKIFKINQCKKEENN